MPADPAHPDRRAPASPSNPTDPRRRRARRPRVRLCALAVAGLLALPACAAPADPYGTWQARRDAGAAGAPAPTVGPAGLPAGACALPPADFTEGQTIWAHHVRPQGTVRALMLFIDFPDAHAAADTKDVYDALAPEAVRWYRASSYGRLDLRIDAVHEWVRMPRLSGGYGYTEKYEDFSADSYLQDAVNAAPDHVDFSPYSIVYLVPNDGADRISRTSYAFDWPVTMPSLVTAPDGAEVRHIVTLGREVHAGVLAHETGHVFGLPDLYDTSHSTHADERGAGNWDVMGASWSFGPDLLAWHKWKLGWLGTGQVHCVAARGASTHVLSQVESPGGVKTLAVRTGPTTVLVAEVRARPVLEEQVDDLDRGVLLYTVDGSVASGDRPVTVHDAHPGDEDWHPLDDAPFDVGRGEVALYRDPSGVTVRVVSEVDGRYTVEVVRP